MIGNENESLSGSAPTGSVGGRFLSVVVVLLASLACGVFFGVSNMVTGRVDLAPTGTIMGALIGGAVAIVILYRRGAWE